MWRSRPLRIALATALLSLAAAAQQPVSVQDAGSSSNRRIPGAISRKIFAALMGMVQATDDRTLPGTVIVLTSADGRRSSAMVGGDGVFRIAALPAGIYSLT